MTTNVAPDPASGDSGIIDLSDYDELPMALSEAQLALKTYYNYVNAWSLTLGQTYGDLTSPSRSFLAEQQTLTPLRELRGGRPCTDELSRAFHRGQLTLKAMELPIDEYPHLALTANLWLPVQAYFAIHGMGMAALIAMGQNEPRSHNAFRTVFADSIVRYLPYPLCGLCKGGPRIENFVFSGIDTSASRVSQLSNLTDPARAQEDQYIGKSLSTTRQKVLDELLGQARQRNVKPGRSRRNLPSEEARRIADRLHSTSVVDLLYRMRLRSNYEDPDMYMVAFDDVDGAVGHYRSLTYLVSVLVEGLCTLVRRGIGTEAMERLESGISSV